MKKTLLLLLMAVVSISASAQFESGTSYVSASVTGMNLSYNKLSKFNIGLQAKGGYFLEDGWMALGGVEWGMQDGHSDLGVEAAGRYYMQQNGLYFNLGLKYKYWGLGSCGQSTVYVTPEVGYCFYLNKHVSLEPAVYYDVCLNKFSDFSTFGLKVGLGFYF